MTYQKIQSYFFLAFLIGFFALLVYIFSPYLQGLMIALILAVIFWPVHKRILLWLKGGENLASIFTVLIIVVAIMIPLAFIASQITFEVSTVYGHIVKSDGTFGIQAVHNLEKFVSEYTFAKNFSLLSVAKTGTSWIATNFGSIFSSATSLVVNILIGLIALFYIFKNGDELKDIIIRISPLSDKYDKQIMEKLGMAINSVIRGAIVVAVIQGILTGLGFFIFGVPNPTLWGSLAVLASLIPNIGTAVVTIPAIIYLLAVGSFGPAIGLLIWGIVAVGLIDNFLGPQFMKKGMAINPFLILLSVLGGITTFGPIGFIIGPMILSIFLVMLEIYKKEFREYLENQSKSS